MFVPFILSEKLVQISPGYPQSLVIPAEGVELLPTTSSIFFFPDLTLIDFTETSKFVNPPNTLKIHPYGNTAVEIVFGLLNTPSGSCQWKVITDSYFRIGEENMSDDSLMCLAIFSKEPEKTNYIIRTVDIDPDDRIYLYTDNNQLIYQMESYDTYSLAATSFALFYRTDSYMHSGSITVYDEDIFESPGQHTYLIDENKSINILALYFLIIHNSQYFEFEIPESAVTYKNGTYEFPNVSIVNIKAIGGPHVIYYDVIKPPLDECKEVIIYDGSKAQFSVDGNTFDKRCFILSSLHTMDYSIYVKGFGGEVHVSCPMGDFIAALTGDEGFIARKSSIFIHIDAGSKSEGSTVCLEKSEIISPVIEGEVFNNMFTPVIISKVITPFTGDFYRFNSGIYHYYIPEQGSTFKFNKYSLYIFHNPRNFTASGKSISFLGDKSAIINITDMDVTATIQPNPGVGACVLNISVINYKDLNLFEKCNSVDIVAMPPFSENDFAASYSIEKFSGIDVNFTIKPNQRVCLWYVSTSPFTLKRYSQGLDIANRMTFRLELQGSFLSATTMSSIRSRSVLMMWTTKDNADGEDNGGSSIIASGSNISTQEVGGIFRGTRSYMDFPWATYNEPADNVFNLGTAEVKLNFTTPTKSGSKKLSPLTIGLICAGIIVAMIIIITIICSMKGSFTRKDIAEKRMTTDKGEELSDIEDANNGNNYMSRTPSPIGSAASTTTGQNSATSTLTVVDPSNLPKNPYDTSVHSTNDDH